jgi:amino acid transporter
LKEVDMSEVAEVNESDATDEGLRHGVLGLFDSVIMGIAGSAPGYSIAGTATVLFATVLYGGAAALLYCGICMFGIVFAFSYLSRDDSHAGAAYSWVRRAIHPILGYLSGWALVVSALIFMVIATFPAGGSVINIFTSSAPGKTATTIIGAIFFMLMVAAVAAGVTVTVKVQIIMSSIEVGLLVLFAALAVFHGHHVTSFSWSWFSWSVFHHKGSGTFAAGALIAAFFYWGWDVTANLNEETKEPKTTSGTGGVIGVIVVFLLFEVFTVATNLVLTPAQLHNPNNASDILAVLGQAVWRGWGGKLLILAVVLSTVATLETTLIQVTRTLFTMGRDNTLPKALGRIDKVRKTPVVATMTAAVLSLLLFVGSSYVGSVYTILSDGVTAIGLQICIYYGLAGLSVVILYRRQLFQSVGNFIFMGLWPLVGAVFMGYVLINQVNSLRTTNAEALWIGLGSMALGLIPLFYYWRKGNPYFKMPSKLDRHAQQIELKQMEELL